MMMPRTIAETRASDGAGTSPCTTLRLRCRWALKTIAGGLSLALAAGPSTALAQGDAGSGSGSGGEKAGSAAPSFFSPARIPAWWRRILGARTQVSFGVGMALRPRYPGADATKVSPIAFVDVRVKDHWFFNVTDGLGIFLVNREKGRRFYYEATASIAPGFESRSRKELPGLKPVGKTALARLAGSIGYGPLALDLSLNQDLIGKGHDGFYATLALQAKMRAFGRTLLSVGPELRFADARYMSSFYDVPRSEAKAAGLVPFDAGGGLERFGGRVMIAYPLAPHWKIFSLIRYERLLGDACQSPVSVEDHRLSTLLALGYRF